MSVERKQRQNVSDRIAARLRTTRFGRQASRVSTELRRRVVPNHLTNLFGVVTAACVVMLFGTGLVLMFFYTPSNEVVTYEGSYAPLHGAEVSKAFASTMQVTFDVPGGLLVRQAHHWAALLLPAAVILQMLSIFFTGGFRRPRRAAWVLLFLVFVSALAAGWSGYALPDDMLSGTGLRIVEGIVLAIPFIGTPVSRLLFGGEFPGNVLANLYPLHLVASVALVALLVVRGVLWLRHRSPQFRGSGRSESRVVGIPLVPNAARRGLGLGLIVSGILVLISATVTISPIWLYGPASPGDAGAGSQPDWYTGFLDGALRLVPPGWEFVWLDRTWTLALLVPLAVITVGLAVVAVYPFLEEWITDDHRDHHLLDRPRDTPSRTGIGVAGLTFFGVLWLAGSADLVAVAFSLTIETVVATLQVAVLIGPVIAFELTRRVCLGLQRKDREIVLHGFETGRIVRLPGGEYIEVHQPVDDDERARLTGVVDPRPELLRPDERGRITPARRLRVRLSRFFFEDRIVRPVAPAELEPQVAEPRPHEVSAAS
ncbi:cytochrome bc1 complex cytochrome b subunit [Agromyces ramosus]|uniref:Cytochrome bc1 complex cytochrome b subunit n=1 Tax=Agromyces ramosus TaxID=33879 RepID=A0ABU0R9Z4_9MICO|nr:cytochrome b N-terminal domain-containing protein [Agromyces ramosus]MDQ0894888.1 ubiquinol-cytochrome c reductase cytochrome b subunit [Agromyces ramosus]